MVSIRIGSRYSRICRPLRAVSGGGPPGENVRYGTVRAAEGARPSSSVVSVKSCLPANELPSAVADREWLDCSQDARPAAVVDVAGSGAPAGSAARGPTRTARWVPAADARSKVVRVSAAILQPRGVRRETLGRNTRDESVWASAGPVATALAAGR